MSEDRSVQVFRIHIDATPEQVWAGITDSAFTTRYGYAGAVDLDLTPGGHFRHLATEEMKAMGMPEVVVVGQILEADRPRRLVQTWKPTWLDEPETTLTYDVEPTAEGLTRLTLTHECTGAPETAVQVSGAGPADVPGTGGWPWVLSGLKTLLESGATMGARG